MNSKISFTVQAKCGPARSGRLRCDKQTVDTPLLVQTAAVTAILTSEELRAAGTQAIKQSALAYWLRAGGQPTQLGFTDIHDYLQWPGIVVGTTGAAQAYRWAKPRGRKKTGVSFHDPATNQQKLYTPQLAQEWQQLLGCDLQTGFARWEDYYAPVDDLQAAARQTAAWNATNALPATTLLPLVGGGLRRVRQTSIAAARKKHPLGYVLAGIDPTVKLAEQRRIISELTSLLPEVGIRYLPTSGALEQVLTAIIQGVDIVDSDCAALTAQNGGAFAGTKRLHLAKDHFARDSRILVPGCQCPTCRAGYSRAYLHQLLTVHQAVGVRLLTLHNLFVLNQLVVQLRQAIALDRLQEFRAALAIN